MDQVRQLNPTAAHKINASADYVLVTPGCSCGTRGLRAQDITVGEAVLSGPIGKLLAFIPFVHATHKYVVINFRCSWGRRACGNSYNVLCDFGEKDEANHTKAGTKNWAVARYTMPWSETTQRLTTPVTFAEVWEVYQSMLRSDYNIWSYNCRTWADEFVEKLVTLSRRDGANNQQQ